MEFQTLQKRLWKSKGTLLLGAVLLAQSIFLIWANLTQLRYHIGYDASSDYLRAWEMYRQGRWIPAEWIDTTTLHLDAPVPLAALFLHLTKDVFVAFGLANIVCVAAFCVAMVLLLRQMQVPLNGRLLALDLLLCPYLVTLNNVNDLGYASCMLVAMAPYVLRLALAALFYSELLRRDRTPVKLPRDAVLTVLLGAGFFVTGLSSGYYMGATLVLPALVYYLYRALQQGDLHALKQRGFALSVGLLLLLVVGVQAAARVLQWQDRSTALDLVTVTGLSENLNRVLAGWMLVFNALPIGPGVVATSSLGIRYLLALPIAAAVLCAGLCAAVRVVRHVFAEHPQEMPDGFCLVGIAFAINGAILVLLQTVYGAFVYEERYLITLVVLGVAALVWLLYHNHWRKTVQTTVLLLLFVCVVLRTLCGDITYTKTVIDTAFLDQISATVAELPSPVVYYKSERYAIELRNMRCWDLDHVYKDIADLDGNTVVNAAYRSDPPAEGISDDEEFRRWGDTTRFDTAAEWDGPVVLIAEPTQVERLPEALRQELALYSHLADDLAVYTAEHNVLGL